MHQLKYRCSEDKTIFEISSDFIMVITKFDYEEINEEIHLIYYLMQRML